MSTVARNAPCPCGSGQKYKRCCFDEHQAEATSKQRVLPIAIAVAGILGGAVLLFTHGFSAAGPVAVGGIVIAIAVNTFSDPPPPKSGGDDPAAMNFGR